MPPRVPFRKFSGAADILPATAKLQLVELAEEIVAVLAQDAASEIELSLEVTATFPNGVTEQIRRAVSENAKTLKLRRAEWEE